MNGDTAVPRTPEMADLIGKPVEPYMDVLGPLFLSNDDGPDAPYPSSITIYCDRCRAKDTRDYTVTDRMTKADRFEAARIYLRTDHGWSCGADGDFCPDCAHGVSGSQTD